MTDEDTAEDLINELNAAAPHISFAARFATFKGFVYDKKFIAKCSSAALAHAGFYSTATPKLPNSAKCPFCLLELNFAENDDPWELHKAERPNCDFVMINRADELSLKTIANLALRCATMVEYERILNIVNFLENFSPRKDKKHDRAAATEEMIAFRNSSRLLLKEQRLETFNYSARGMKKPLPTILRSLARAGFCSSVTDPGHLDVMCPFCLVNIKFTETDRADDFWNAHKDKAPNCEFVKLNKLRENDWSTEEGLMLAARLIVMEKYERHQELVDDISHDFNPATEKLIAKLSRMMAKPRFTRRSSCLY